MLVVAAQCPSKSTSNLISPQPRWAFSKLAAIVFPIAKRDQLEKDPVARNKVPFFVRYADRDFRFHVGRDGLHEDKPPQEAHERRLFASL